MNFQIVIYFILALSTVVSGKNVRIIGGEDADITEMPYIVSFRNIRENEHFCSGAIISNYHVLSAAHCFIGLRKCNIKIYAGAVSYTKLSSFFNIYDIKIHPNFISRLQPDSTPHNDIALVTVSSFIVFDENQNKINLPTESSQSGSNSIISGWGWTIYPRGNISPILKKASVKLLISSDCKEQYPYRIFDEQICSFERRGVGTCFGDSGGPLVSNGILVGISSFNFPCALGVPDIYSNVYSYLDFINSSMTVRSNLSCCLPL